MLLYLPTKAYTQPDNNSLSEIKVLRDSAEAGFNHLHHFRFKRAEQVKEYISKNHSDNFLSKFYNANYHWWKIVTGYDTEEEKSLFQDNLITLERYFDEVKEESLTNRQFYILINTHAYKARLHVLKKDYVKALIEVNRSIHKIKRSFGKEEQYNWFYLTSGIYNYHIEHAKKEHPLMLPYFVTLPKGSKEKGIKHLQTAVASNNKLLSTEARYFLMRIYLDKEKNYPKSRELCKQLVKKYPENLVFRYYAFLTELYDGKEQKAIELLEKLVLAGKQNKEFSEKQLNHFVELTKEDLKNYYLNSEE